VRVKGGPHASRRRALAGEFQESAPSEQPVTWTGIFIFRLACGRIAETWVESDALTQIARVAATPTP
jgi:SnoaL-like polyketide cyclase